VTSSGALEVRPGICVVGVARVQHLTDRDGRKPGVDALEQPLVTATAGHGVEVPAEIVLDQGLDEEIAVLLLVSSVRGIASVTP
jgi:hypothetical protein